MSFSEIGLPDKKRKIEDDEESLDSEASYIILESANCGQRLKSFFIRLIASLVVLAACSGALYWSFEHGEQGTDFNETRDASKNFSIHTNEYSKKYGNYSITYRLPDAQTNKHLSKPVSYPSWWYQDNDNQMIVHRRDNVTTLYIYFAYSYWVTTDSKGNIVSCRYDHMTNYTSYIERLGLNHLTRDHSAYETTHNHEKVFVYDGDPTDVINEDTRQNAFLVTAYADAYSGVLLGWDTYYSSSASSKVYLISYWYDTMEPGKDNPDVFNPPEECHPYPDSRRRTM